MLNRRVILAGGLAAASAVVALADAPPPPSVFEAFFREFGSKGRIYAVRQSVLDATAVPNAPSGLLQEFPPQRIDHHGSDFGAIPVRLVSDGEYLDIFSDARSCFGGWEEFHKRYAGAEVLIAMSLVRFSKDNAQAAMLVQISSSCSRSTLDKYRFVRTSSGWKFADAENLGRA